MRLWWQQEMAKLRTLTFETAEEHAALVAVLVLLIVPLLLAFILAFTGTAFSAGIS